MTDLTKVEQTTETLLFQSRWLAAPIYLGLVFGLILLLVAFFNKLAAVIPELLTLKPDAAILHVLTFIDLALIANLLLIVIFSGYESFVSKFDVKDHPDRPDWISQVGFSGLKLKLFASLVAISGIELLKAFMAARATGEVLPSLPWLIGIHAVFLLSVLVTALASKLRGSATN
ncbi:TIGR00645 family protein [Sphingomicrobium sediminis]|uniref:UPF0114 protein NDO55_10950 n=1 Tax=Sphingomicrobium sediminis TaxID=2950949 RepID=A0A9X2EIW4_9SPHN|nr:TIGR00645 family protein [Sphingomicrobium sediminis]MCM8558335.1 TIGR00645 family protein [Sphingomicrobium sediminis]